MRQPRFPCNMKSGGNSIPRLTAERRLRRKPVDTANFGLIVDAGYSSGGSGLEQAFLVDPPPSPVPEPLPAVLIGLGLVTLGLTRWLPPLPRPRRCRTGAEQQPGA